MKRDSAGSGRRVRVSEENDSSEVNDIQENLIKYVGIENYFFFAGAFFATGFFASGFFAAAFFAAAM